MKQKVTAILLLVLLLMGGCADNTHPETDTDSVSDGSIAVSDTTAPSPDTNTGSDTETDSPSHSEPDTTAPSQSEELGDTSATFGENLSEMGIYDGYFEGESTDIQVKWVSGTKNAYKLEGTTLTFTSITKDTVYAISGTLNGTIVIDVGDNHKFDLEMHGFSLVSANTNPIRVISGAEVSLKAKKNTKNYIYDTRPAIDPNDPAVLSAAIYAEVDLEIAGKGILNVVSENNNGIHTKDDLQVKNLTLTIACIDNALKGNDSVEITDGVLTLIASGGDCIKTTNSDISNKGKQRGTVSIIGGSHTLYAACDGIDAAYDVMIDSPTTDLKIYTDKYSNYSREVTAIDNDKLYIRFSSQKYVYSVKFINSADGSYEWVTAEYHSKASGGRTTYYYYAFPRKTGYDKMQFFVYSENMAPQQENDYTAASDVMEISKTYDTIALSSNTYNWTNYTTVIQNGGFGGSFGGFGGPGGMNDGNADKISYSAKGIKVGNEIKLNAGTVNIKSYDDAFHANNADPLDNGASPLGNITISGGTLTVFSNDDGIHADGILSIQAGSVTVTNAYEGLEGTQVRISGGSVSINAKDDGINATASSGNAIEIRDGTVYICCSGDGIDANSRTSYGGIVFSGGKTIVISDSQMNSALDTEQGYTYTSGTVIAIMPRGGMSGESTHCSNFKSVGNTTQLSLKNNEFLTVSAGKDEAVIRNPFSMSALIIVLGDSSPNITTQASTAATLDANGVAWN